MRKLIYLLLWLVPFFSQAQHTLGNPNQTPDLKIAYRAYDWSGSVIGIVTRTETTKIKVNSFNWPPFLPGDSALSIGYSCPVVNIASQDVTGKNDLSVCMPCDGKLINGQYTFDGLISVQLYKVLPTLKLVSTYNKLPYWFSVDYLYGYKDALNYCCYPDSFMSIQPLQVDKYFNHVYAPINSSSYYILRVWINPKGYITESDYSNNITLAAYNIQDNNAVLDSTGLQGVISPPVDSLSGKVTWGSSKYVDLKWVGNGETYYIFKAGMLLTTTNTNTYRDSNLASGFKQATYSVQSEIKGFGISQAKSVTVKR